MMTTIVTGQWSLTTQAYSLIFKRIYASVDYIANAAIA
jgi:hypothetical protein